MFSRIKDSIDKGIVSVSVKSSTYLETEKLRTKVENVDAKKRTAAAEMGAAVYEQWKCGSVNMEYIETMCSHMSELEKEIKGYQLQIGQLEQEKAKILGQDDREAGQAGAGIGCSCGYLNESGAKFCVQCGATLQVQEELVAGKVICPDCGMESEQGAKFCCGCGKPLA